MGLRNKLNLFNKLYLFIISLVLVVLSSSTMVYADTKTDLPASFLIGDKEGIHVNANGEYYIYQTNIKPGDVITKTLTITNTENDKPFTLTMSSEPIETSGPIDLLDKIHLDLILDNKVIYSGRLYGDADVNMIKNSLDLGIYNSGDSKTLNIVLTVDNNIKLSNEKSIAEIGWKFVAIKGANSDIPKTGEIAKISFYIVISLMILISFILFIIRKKQDKSSNLKIKNT